MTKLKRLYAAMIQRLRQAGFSSQIVAVALKQRRRPAGPSEDEIERLDRLRNPSKYRGK